MNKNKRYSIIDRRFSALDGTPLNPQDLEGVPSHRCLILDQSFEALKTARSSTEAMKRVQQEMEDAVSTEGEKNDQYKKTAMEYASFSQEIDSTAHGMASMTKISNESESSEQTQMSQDGGQIENRKNEKEDT